MKLLCVTNGPMFDGAIHEHWAIKFGEVYNAIAERIIFPHGKYYILSEDPRYGYAEEHFVVLPDEEEIEAAELDAELAETMKELENA